MKTANATIQIVWESLNGVMHDLSVGNIVDANETIGDLINLLEEAGANPDKEKAMTQAIKKDGWALVHERTGKPVLERDVVLDFRGEADTIIGGRPPHKPSSSGFIHTADNREVYPSVFDLKWIRAE